MSDRDISHLYPPLQDLYRQWLQKCTAAGLSVKAIVTWRSAEDQDMAKMKGLSNASAGCSPHNIVDNNGNPSSWAFDFGVFESNGNYVADGDDPRYRQAGEIGKNLGLEYGGDWTHVKPDEDHLELPGWHEYRQPSVEEV